MSNVQSKQRTNALRQIPLYQVAEACGLVYYKTDRQWKDEPHHSMGIAVELDGRWNDLKAGKGSGGAIDLVMHIKQFSDFREAVSFLSEHFSVDGTVQALVNHTEAHGKAILKQFSREKSPITVPDHPDKYPQVEKYLTQERMIDPVIVQRLRESGQLVADSRGNAVFLGKDKDGQTRIAEKRGTSKGSDYKGLETGSNRDYFVSRHTGSETRKVVLVESAIDLTSYIDRDRQSKKIESGTLYVSTSGCRPTTPLMLLDTINKASVVVVAYDNDAAGNRDADKLIIEIGVAKCVRDTPLYGKDWNDTLKAERKLASAKGLSR